MSFVKATTRRGLSPSQKIKLGPTQLPNLYNVLPVACRVLGIAEPELYLEMDPAPNAYTLGHYRPSITITSGLVEHLDEEELQAVRFEFDPAPVLETLMLHFCGEIRLSHWYRRAAEWHTEPVIKRIYLLISQDEARHGGAYLRFMRRAIERAGVEAKRAFAKIGVLMASGNRAGKPLHPTNLHVNKHLFPCDTVQSRLPDPSWLERWLDEQIAFDSECEHQVSRKILRTLSSLLGQHLETVQQLNRLRKTLVAA